MLFERESKEKAAAILSHVSTHSSFQLHQGRELRSLRDLYDALGSMSPDIFQHHVSPIKNDFANWIQDILGDDRLAKKIMPVKDKEKVRSLIEERIQELNRILEKDKKIEQKPQPYGPSNPQLQQSYGALQGLASDSSYLRKKMDEMAQKEREIMLREAKILEIENNIEQQLQGKTQRFFSKEFIQGFLIGILVFLVAVLIFIKLSGSLTFL